MRKKISAQFFTFPYDQYWLDFVAGGVVAGATAAIPTHATPENKVHLGSLLVDTTEKKTYVVTAIANDGTITQQQIGAWT